MDPFSLVLGAGILVLATWAFLKNGPAVHKRHIPAPEPSLRRPWRAAAKRLDLTSVEEDRMLADPTWLMAHSGQLRVRLEKIRTDERVATRIEVRGVWHVGEGLTVRREETDHGTAWRLATGGIETGEPNFDREFRVKGQESLALAVLDRETRWGLADLLRGFVFVEGKKPIEVRAELSTDRLEVRVGHDPKANQASLSRQVFEVLRAALRLAHRLIPPDDLAGRLAGNLRDEPEAGVRLRILRVLLREFPQDRRPAVRDAVLATCEDPSALVRLAAGIGLGEEGQGTLRALAADPATSEYCAARAVEALGKGWPSVAAEATLGRALIADRFELAKACLGWLARFGRPEAEGPLLGVLGHRDPEIVLSAAHALGRVGTVAAVPALRELEARGPRDPARTARQAIAEIQARLTGAEHGQISLAGAEAGALSLVTDSEPGQLSLVEPAVIEQEAPAGRALGRS